jgi:hypothetical protein
MNINIRSQIARLLIAIDSKTAGLCKESRENSKAIPSYL